MADMPNLNTPITGAVAPAEASLPIAKRMTPERLSEAVKKLQEYKQGKANLEARIIDNDQWYKMRCYPDGGDRDFYSAWLFNAISNKHADAMDNVPEANVLPREQSDEAVAQALSSVIPVILQRSGFEATYSAHWTDKLKGGTGVLGVFWDSAANNGLGDVAIKTIDALNLFWEPGVEDIQLTPHLYCVELRNNDALERQYPQLNGRTGQGLLTPASYIYDDNVKTESKSAVIDWYYKVEDGVKTTLHYCKFCNEVVLYASEDDPEYAQRGFYDHGQYPFVFDPLFTDKGTPCGFGYVDVGRGTQIQIDLINKGILQHVRMGTTPRFFINAGGDVNEEEFADWTKSFVHIAASGDLNDKVKPIEMPSLPGVYPQIYASKIDELKETTGNRDFSQGGTTAGVTAASAIAALQEAGSKLSRDMIKGSYRAYEQVIRLTIELIRQFYDERRVFRIVAPDGGVQPTEQPQDMPQEQQSKYQYVELDNSALKPQPQTVLGVQLAESQPLFDIEITVQKSSPYSKQSQNELALNFYAQGFFAPQNAPSALAALNMMQFDGKDGVVTTIRQNGDLYDKLMQISQIAIQQAQMIDQLTGQDTTSQIAAQVDGTATAPSGGAPRMSADNSLVGQAKRRVADSTSPK